MPFYKITKLFLFSFLWFNVAFSQNFPSKNYTAANELPNNTVRALLVDSNNILWIGTDNGVVKKENDVFKYFFEEDGLALNSCWAIAEDKNKKLWFGSYGEGISVYDGYKFRVLSEKEGLVHNEITKLFSYGNYMYVGTSDGVSKIDITTFEIESWSVPAEDELIRINGFFESKGQVYVGTYNTGIYKLTEEQNQTRLVKVNDHKNIYAVFKDKDSIYSSNQGFFTKNHIADYLNEKDSLSSEKLGYSIIWDHVKTKDNRIFAAAWGIYDTNGGIYEIQDNAL
ncbi:MAG: two-component regulator propeller domain-containing protein, partial [Christiangramia sp.]